MIEMITRFSPQRKYRYTLWRKWSGLFQDKIRYAMFIGLNPSTADETLDDPTIRRCIGFAKAWGYDALCMTNLFAFRSTDPDVMKAQPNPVGRHNDRWLVECADHAGVVVAAWGNDGAYRNRGNEVRSLINGLKHLRLTKSGHPAHPLYLPKNLVPLDWD